MCAAKASVSNAVRYPTCMGEGRQAPTRRTADFPAGGDSKVDELNRRVGRELEEIGLTADAPWVASIVLYGSGGLTVLAAAVLVPGAIPGFVQLLAGLAILMALFAVWGFKSGKHMGWSTPIRVLVGIAIIFAGGLSDPRSAASLGVILMFPMISPAYLYTAKRSLPYGIIGTASLVTIVLLAHYNDWFVAQAVISGAVMFALVGSVIFSQARIRMLIRLHHERAVTDPLTGLANMRGLRDRLAHEIEASACTGGEFALLAIDLDNFKRVNDEIDHRTGDAVLAAVGDALREHVDAHDLVARRGGDEFSVVVSDAGDRDLDELARRLRSAIVAARRQICPRITPSGSVGYVTCTAADTPESALEHADAALHADKSRFHSGVSPMRRRLECGGDAALDIARKRAGAGTGDRERAERRPGILGSLGRRTFIVGGVALLVALLVTGTAVFADTGELGAGEAVLVSLGLLGVVAAAHFVKRLGLGDWALHALHFAMSALIVTAVMLAGDAGTALLDLCLLPALIGFFIFSARAAAVWFALMLSAMSAIALTGAFPNAGVRMGATVAVATVVATMIAKLRKLTVKYMAHHVEMSQLDGLTGLANRRLLEQNLVERLERVADGERVTVIAVDLDEFKLVNDIISHSFGDRLLCDVAETIRRSTRPEDLVARRGGDEFYVVCDAATRAEAEAAARRIADAIAETRLEICPNINPTATVVTVESEPGDDAAALLYRADVALHAAKAETHRLRERARRHRA